MNDLPMIGKFALVGIGWVLVFLMDRYILKPLTDELIRTNDLEETDNE